MGSMSFLLPDPLPAAAAATLPDACVASTVGYYDQTPVPDKFRTPRLPDSDRVWLAGGAQWSHNKLNVDLSAAYIFLNDGSIKLNGNPPSTAQNALLKGDYSHHAFVVSGQASYSF